MDDWRLVTTMPEGYPSWIQFYANALQDALRKANARRKEALSQMTVEDWRLAVGREMRADMWYQNAEHENGSSLSFSHAVEAIIASSNWKWLPPKSERCRRVRYCAVCEAELPVPSELGARRRVYCSNACRQRAKRQRTKSIGANH
jgi:hypothetical protein